MDIIEPQLIEILGEQDGEIERKLKQKLVPILEEAGDVRSAYLAIADYRDGSPPSVVLCLRSDNDDNAVLAVRIGKVFAELFNAKEHLDVLFMDSQRERVVRAVCSAFYSRRRLRHIRLGLHSIFVRVTRTTS